MSKDVGRAGRIALLAVLFAGCHRAEDKTMCEEAFVPRKDAFKTLAQDVLGDDDKEAQANAKTLHALAARMQGAAKGHATKVAQAIVADAAALEERATLLERAGAPDQMPTAKPASSSDPSLTPRQQALRDAAEMGAKGLAGPSPLHLSPATWDALDANSTRGLGTWNGIFDACFKITSKP